MRTMRQVFDGLSSSPLPLQFLLLHADSLPLSCDDNAASCLFPPFLAICDHNTGNLTRASDRRRRGEGRECTRQQLRPEGGKEGGDSRVRGLGSLAKDLHFEKERRMQKRGKEEGRGRHSHKGDLAKAKSDGGEREGGKKRKRRMGGGPSSSPPGNSRLFFFLCPLLKMNACLALLIFQAFGDRFTSRNSRIFLGAF